MTVIASESRPGQSIEVQPSQLVGATARARSWTLPNDAISEVANPRVWGGIHYRNSTDAGIAMGRSIGKFGVDTKLQPLP
jgi:hypothetical protein